MQQIILQPGNPLELRPEELEDLAQAIRELHPNYEVRIEYQEQVGRGVTWWEVLTIWLPTVSGDISLLLLIGQAVAWARRRFKQQESEQLKKHEDKQAKQLPKRQKSKSYIEAV